jgi:hypothetical protein
MRKFYATALLAAVILISFSSLNAQPIALDNAEDAAYASGWTNGTNGGNGFNAWVINGGANTGTFIGDPVNDSMKNDGVGSKAFALYATGTAYINAGRSFKSPLQIGDEFSFYWVMNWDAGAGTKGFDIKAGGATVFNVNNGNSKPAITTSADTALRQYGTLPMLVKLKRLSADLYSFSMTGRVEGESYNTTINTAFDIDGIDFYMGFQNDGDGRRNIYFNNFKITSSTSSVSNLKHQKELSIYPNPVQHGTSLQVDMKNRAAGKYTVTLYNISGLRMQQNILRHNGGNGVQPIVLDAYLKSGIYLLEVMNEKGEKEQTKLIVE